MNITVSTQELETAPPYVRQWFTELMTGAPSVDPPPELQTETPAAEEPPKLKDVLTRAAEFLKANGEDALQTILTKLDIKRVKECPPEKLAELLAEIAVA